MDFLVGIIPAPARRYVYAGLTLAVLILGALRAYGGDWKAATASLVISFWTAVAHANTDTTASSERGMSIDIPQTDDPRSGSSS
jgi:hypothetical protein